MKYNRFINITHHYYNNEALMILVALANEKETDSASKIPYVIILYAYPML